MCGLPARRKRLQCGVGQFHVRDRITTAFLFARRSCACRWCGGARRISQGFCAISVGRGGVGVVKQQLEFSQAEMMGFKDLFFRINGGRTKKFIAIKSGAVCALKTWHQVF
jgi:hypothetical protein